MFPNIYTMEHTNDKLTLCRVSPMAGVPEIRGLGEAPRLERGKTENYVSICLDFFGGSVKFLCIRARFHEYLYFPHPNSWGFFSKIYQTHSLYCALC
jgi:hypothetical protein